MKCEICQRGPLDGESVYRVNPLGVTGIWRCWKHLNSEQRAEVDPEVENIVSLIEEDNRRKERGEP